MQKWKGFCDIGHEILWEDRNSQSAVNSKSSAVMWYSCVISCLVRSRNINRTGNATTNTASKRTGSKSESCLITGCICEVHGRWSGSGSCDNWVVAILAPLLKINISEFTYEKTAITYYSRSHNGSQTREHRSWPPEYGFGVASFKRYCLYVLFGT